MRESLEGIKKELDYEKTKNCVQCGYCLPVCPTYATMGKETHSPRGRINLVKMAGEGKIQDLSILQEPMDLCLGCRACETACPTGVEYGSILEAARQALTRRKKYSFPIKLLRSAFFKKVIPSKKAMNRLVDGMWLYEKSGLKKAARLPARLAPFASAVPPAASPSERRSRPSYIPAKGQKKYAVAIFTGCIMDAMFHRINRLSAELLALAGCDVWVLESQTCCGALHAHAGEKELSMKLAKQNIEAFEQREIDFVVNNAGGCGAMLAEYGKLLATDAEWAGRAKRFSEKSRDISQVLALCGGIPWSGEPVPQQLVTYQPSCHMTHVEKVVKEPRQLIKSVPNVEFVEMNEADMCCGSAGIYNLVHYDAAMEILDRKMEDVKETEAMTIITTNPGCLLQMKMGVKRHGQSARVLHLIEFLAEAAKID